MTTLRVQRIIDAPIDVVFDAYTDHAALALVPGIWSAEVVQPGVSEPNGQGAVREALVGVMWFREEITAFERPHLMEYRIRKSIPPLDHKLGRVEFSETPEGTLVTWTSIFDTAVPVIGAALEPVGKVLGTVGFGWVLKCLDDRLTS